MDYVVLLCRDLAPMLHFYHAVLGLSVYRELPGWIELQVGSSLLTLRRRDRPYDGAATSGAAGVQLAFRVTPDDLDAWHTKLVALGVAVLAEPADKGYGHRTVFYRDPEGNIVELYADVPVKIPDQFPAAQPEALRKENQPVEQATDLRQAHLRVARATDDLAAVVKFYRDGLGFEVVYEFQNHDGFDGVMLGHKGSAYHLEFTRKAGHRAGRASTEENLLVFYLPDAAQWQRAVARLEGCGYKALKSFNPYWDRKGKTFEDPDGYRVVLQNASWSS
jgi:catechol 2,3-dioxygenase-like lactoylglutathione lyase family enzyme